MIYSVVTGAPFLGCFVGALFVLLASASLLQNCSKKKGIIVLIIFIKYILTMYQAMYKNLPLGGEDWWNYHNNAQAIIASSDGIVGCFANSADLFSKIVAVLYSLFGVHTMYINLFVLGSSIVAAKYVYKLTILLTDGDEEASEMALLFFMIWPIDVIYSVTYLREMPIQMLVVMSFYSFVAFKEYSNILNLVKAFTCIIFACMMHSGVIAMFAVYMIYVLANKWDTHAKILSSKNVLLVLGAVILIRVSPLWSIVATKLGNITTVDNLVARSQQFGIEANTQYVSEMPSSLAGFITQMPIRAFLFAFVPLPWMVYNIETGISWLIDALPQVWFIYRLYKLNKLTRGTRNRYTYVMWILSLAGVYLVCGMGTSAYGNAIRHRAKILPVMIAFVVGLYKHLKSGYYYEIGE